jgi:hypothetical protein
MRIFTAAPIAGFLMFLIINEERQKVIRDVLALR